MFFKIIKAPIFVLGTYWFYRIIVENIVFLEFVRKINKNGWYRIDYKTNGKYGINFALIGQYSPARSDTHDFHWGDLLPTHIMISDCPATQETR